MPRVCVDTQLWEYAFTDATEPAYRTLHDESDKWLQALLKDPDTVIVLSVFHLAEILEVLRTQGVELNRRAQLLTDFLTRNDKYEIVPLETRHVLEAFELGSRSDIHLWDYLVALPVAPQVSTIYSADRHFRHEHFQQRCAVQNPVPWDIIEGHKPQSLSRHFPGDDANDPSTKRQVVPPCKAKGEKAASAYENRSRLACPRTTRG